LLDMEARTVRVGCSSAFWGDSVTGAWQLVTSEGKELHYLVADYLAEVTMAILARSKDKTAETVKGGAGEGGFVNEFVQFVWKPLMKQLLKNKTKIVTNAGGMNPLACKAAIEQAARDAGLEVPVVAAVTGDDLMGSYTELLGKAAFTQFAELKGEAEPAWHQMPDCRMMSFNAYFGAFPIAEALAQGAQIVVTGRCADSALVLGPLIYEFGWKPTDFHLLSAGSLAGHIIECGCQATGGNFTDWEESLAGGQQESGKGNGWDNVGFPIAECRADGSFIITKPANTGGLVSVGTVAEQMLYEIHNPGAYILPDVICNWQHVQITQLSKNRVAVSGAFGLPPTPYLKVSATSLDGWKIGALLMIGGIDARRKALAVAEAILARSRRLLAMRGMPDFRRTCVEVLGAEHSYGLHARPEVQATREVVLHMNVHHNEVAALGVFGREVAPAATAMAPGITGGGTGRPRPQPLIRHSAVLVDRGVAPATVYVGDQPARLVPSTASAYTPLADIPSAVTDPTPYHPSHKARMVEVPLIRLCFGRSGDKGDVANVGLIARDPKYYPLLKAVLTEEVVRNYFSHLVKGKVRRFEVPGICGLNFVMTEALGGGGLASLLMDRQGKAYAQMLLSMTISVPAEWMGPSVARL
jgi:hypothetical protein